MAVGTKVAGRTYPRTVKLAGDREATLRIMTRNDRDAVLALVRSQPEDELIFLRMDVTQPGVIDQWIENIEAGRTVTVLAEVDGRLAGYSSVHHNEVLWTRHVGEIRMIIDAKFRHTHLARELAEEIFAISKGLGLRKITAQMTPEQAGTRAIVEHLGFQAEALLAEHVVDRHDETHDLLIMSYDVAGFHDTVGA